MPRDPRHGARPHRPLLPVCLLTFAFCLSSDAGTLRTIDGQTYDGVLKLDTTGHVVVTPTTGPSPAPVPLADVLYADLRAPERPPTPTPPRAAVNPSAQPSNGALPAGWRTAAVGTLADPPYAKFHDATFSLKSAGATVGGTRDAFCFAHQPAGDDVDLVARLHDTRSQQVVAGLTIRAGLAADAPHVSLLYFGDDVRFLRRPRPGRAAEGGPVGGHVNLPIWMRLTRRGDTVATFLSKDGQNWERVGEATYTPAPDTPVSVGLAAFGPGEQLTGAHFDKVRLTSNTPREDAAPAAATITPSPSAGIAVPLRPASLKRGLMLRSGTLLAGADVTRADDGSVTYVKDGHPQTLSLVNVARILFRDLTPQAATRIPAAASGVLLKEGDFVEGEFKGLRDGRVSLSSVLFGLSKFDARDKVAAVAINPPEPGRPDTVVRTSDGSTYAARRVSVEKDRLLIEDPVAGPLTVNRADVSELSIGAGRLEPLADRAAATVDPAASLSLIGPGSATAGIPCERALAIPCGATATWTLDGKFRTFTVTMGVPATVLPTAPVRFVILGDGKEVFRSPPRTSLNEPLSASVNIKGARSLTLKAESTAPRSIPTPTLWADPALIQ
jgi:hypothetical protein